MAAGTLLVRRWRRPLLLAAVVGGLVLGGAEWIVEAYISYGGPAARLHRSDQIEGGLGWHLGVYDQLRTLAGGTMLCRPCTVGWRHPEASLWWLALPFAAVGGVITGIRRRRVGAALPALCGLSAALPYLLFIGYAAPRFLLPSYALLALPVADLLVAAARPGRLRTRPRARRAATAAVALIVLAQLVSQHLILGHAVRGVSRTTGEYARIAADLRAHGVRPDCLVTGQLAAPIAYDAGCASGATAGHNQNMTRAQIVATARTHPVAVILSPSQKLPSYARHWTPHPLTGLQSLHGYRAYLSPSTPGR
jgi:hypothetical protein